MKLRYILAAVGVGAVAIVAIAGLLFGEIAAFITTAALLFGGLGYAAGLAIEEGRM